MLALYSTNAITQSEHDLGYVPADNEDSDQNGQMSRLFSNFTGWLLPLLDDVCSFN